MLDINFKGIIKVMGDRSRERPEDYLFNGYDTKI